MRKRSLRRSRHVVQPALLLMRRISLVLTGVLLLFALVAAILLALAPRAPETPEVVSSISDLEAFFERLVASENPPGISVAVVRGDDVVYQQSFGFADAPAGARATPDTVYRWWSLTKLLTAIAVVQLHEAGRLDLDDEVREHLPFFRVSYRGEEVASVRIEQLLNHSAGLRNLRFEVLRWTHLEGVAAQSANEHLAESFDEYAKLRAMPGTRGYYSNFGYLVLGALVEKVSAQSYEDYVSENILGPLGMERTGFDITDAMRTHLAAGCHPIVDFQTMVLPAIGNLDAYVRDVDGGRIWFEPFYLDANAYGGAIGSVADATRLLRAFIQQGRLEGRPVLSPETVRTMLEDGWVRAGSSNVAPPVHRRAGMRHGLGWWVFPSPHGNMYQHTGAGPGFATIFRLYPEESLGIAVLANATSLDREGITDRLYDLFRDRPEPEPRTGAAPAAEPDTADPTHR